MLDMFGLAGSHDRPKLCSQMRYDYDTSRPTIPIRNEHEGVRFCGHKYDTTTIRGYEETTTIGNVKNSVPSGAIFNDLEQTQIFDSVLVTARDTAYRRIYNDLLIWT